LLLFSCSRVVFVLGVWGGGGGGGYDGKFDRCWEDTVK